jgi:uncharacterized protein
MSSKKQRQIFSDKKLVQTTDTATRQTTSDGFANMTARMGMGAENLLSQGTYIFDLLSRNRVKLEAMYRGSWIVGAAVDNVAEDMTRAGITIKGENTPDQIQQMQSNLTRLGVWKSMLETIKWGRLYGGAIAVIDIDGQDLSTPLDVTTVARGQFKGLRVYDRWQVQPELHNMVQSGRDAGLPMMYGIISDLATGRVGGVRVHHSRVVRQIGIQLPAMQAMTESWWGESIVERMYDRLVSFDTATSGAANLIQKAHLRTVKIDKLREVFAAGGKAEENLMTMFSYMRILQSNEGLTLLDSADEFQTTSYSFAGLSDMILQFGQQISGATGIPLVRLFGQAPAGLNSTGESDMRMYYDNINAQQETDMRDGMMKILRVLHKSLFDEMPLESFDFDFASLWQTSAKEKADIAGVVVTAVTTAFEKGVIDSVTALKELKQSSEQTGMFTNITEEQIKAAETEPVPMPSETAPIDQPTDVAGSSISDRVKAWLIK